jgi:transposase
LGFAHRCSLERPPRERYPPYQTCHRRFQRWVEEGTLSRILEALALDLKERGDLDLSECFIDGTFVVAKKGGSVLERPSGAKVRSSWRLQTALLFLSPSTQRVLLRTKSPLLERLTLCERFVEGCPSKLVGHRAYDSDHLDAHLEAEGIEMISPHRRNRKKAKTQDGRKLRRYRRRWKVERLFAWLGNFRGLVVRYERRVENYLGFPCTSGASSSC